MIPQPQYYTDINGDPEKVAGDIFRYPRDVEGYDRGTDPRVCPFFILRIKIAMGIYIDKHNHIA